MSITEAALTKRIKRKLRPGHQILKKSRSRRAKEELGDSFIVNVNTGSVVLCRVNLVALGRELGVLTGEPIEVQEQ